MLMAMMTGRQAPSSLAAITALENIKLFRFKGFLLQVSGPGTRPGTASLLCVILIMNTGLWLADESVLGSWLVAQWHECQWHNINDLTSSSASVSSLWKPSINMKSKAEPRTSCLQTTVERASVTFVTWSHSCHAGTVCRPGCPVSHPLETDMKHGTIERDWYQLEKHETCNYIALRGRAGPQTSDMYEETRSSKRSLININ